MKMQKLLKEYEVKEVSNYFDIIIESFINGNREQAKTQFKAMPKVQKKQFLHHLIEEDKENRYIHYFIEQI